jgi:hypothetical protein
MDQHIHNILKAMLVGVMDNPGMYFIQHSWETHGYSEEEAKYIRARMAAEGLVVNHDGPGKNGLSELTARGYEIARSPGGYLGIKAENWQKEQQQETRSHQELEYARISAVGTRDAAEVSKRSLWISIIGTVIAAAALGYTIWAANEAQASDARIDALEKQVQELSKLKSAKRFLNYKK